jgi:uncharacterized membrane protein YdjX (TVP38/TMEM64 family)
MFGLTGRKPAGHGGGMAESALRPNRALLLKLAAAAVVLLLAAALVARGFDLKALLQQGLEVIRSAGPAAFFLAMALLPACGVPQLTFALTAGPAYGEQLGMPLVLALSMAALTANLVLTYFLARRALRPPLEKLVARLGYRLPQVEAGDVTDLIIILRVTPGVPFFVQNYLLGLAEVPFGKYVTISCGIAWTFNFAFILFGDALLHGKGKAALISIGLLMALTAATHLVRKHYGRKAAPPA